MKLTDWLFLQITILHIAFIALFAQWIENKHEIEMYFPSGSISESREIEAKIANGLVENRNFEHMRLRRNGDLEMVDIQKG